MNEQIESDDPIELGQYAQKVGSMYTEVNYETMTNLGRGPKLNLFTSADHGIVKQALSCLTETERMIVSMRFWENRKVPEIVAQLNLRQRAVEAHLQTAFEKLKNICMDDSRFSRNPDGAIPPQSPHQAA